MASHNNLAQNNLTKKAFEEVAYSKKEISELKKCLDPVDGPLYFCKKFLRIQHPTKGSLPFKPYPYQERLIYNYTNYRHTISMLFRQAGKCLLGNQTITIRNKNTGEIQEISIGELYELQSQINKQGS